MNNPGRIQIHGEGIGEISDADIERRAEEIARMDGRDEAKDHDRLRAREELENPAPPDAPEADESLNPVRLWSKGAASQGHRGVQTPLEDETSAAEQLVKEGLEEADNDQRLSSSEETSRE